MFTLFLLIRGEDEGVMVLLDGGLKGEARESPLVLIRLLLLLPGAPPDGGPLVPVRFGDSIEGRRIL